MADLSLTTPTDDQNSGLLSLQDTSALGPIVSPEVAKNRGDKAAFGLEDPTTTSEMLASGIASGTEDKLRRDTVQRELLKDRELKARIVSEVLSSKKPEEAVSLEEVAFIKQLSKSDIHNPDTIWEKKFATNVTNSVASLKENSSLRDAAKTNSEDVMNLLDLHQGVIEKKEIAQKVLENIEQRRANMGYIAKGADLAETFVTFLSWFHLQNSTGGDTGPKSSFLSGSNLSEQLDYLHSLPPERFQRELKRVVDDLWTKNSLDALTFARSATAYSTTDKYLNNLFSIVDIASIVPTGVLTRSGSRLLKGGSKEKLIEDVTKSAESSALKDVAEGLKETLKATGKRTLDEGEVVTAVGDIEKGSIINAVKSVQAKLAENDVAGLSKSLEQEMPSLFNPNRIVKGYTGNLGSAALSRITSALPQSAKSLLAVMTDTPNLATLNTAQITKGVMQTVERLIQNTPVTADAFLDVAHIAPETSIANVHDVLISIGTPKGALFETRKNAEHFAKSQYRLMDGSYEIKPHGLGYKIEVKKTIDETTPEVLQLSLTTNNTTPKDLVTALTGAMRSPEDTLSGVHRASRHVVVNGSQEISRLIKEGAKDLGALNRTERLAFEKVARANRDIEINSERGYFYQDLNEFEQGYKDLIGSYPTEKEAKAYFQYVQLNDIDLFINNNNIYRAKARAGIESISVKKGVFNSKTKKFTKEVQAPFEGKFVSSIPERDGVQRNILFVEENGRTRVTKGNVISYKQVREKVSKEGFKIVQVADPTSDLKGLVPDGRPVHFIVVKDVSSGPIPYQQIPKRPGGHVMYPQEWYTKQANISKFEDSVSYNGDTSIFAHSTEAEGRKFSSAMEAARQALAKKNMKRVAELVEENLPFTVDEFKALFEDSAHLPPRLRLDAPIVYTRAGQRTKDSTTIKSMFPDAIDNTVHPDSLVANIDRQYMSERGMTLDSIVKGSGSESEPIFQLEKSKLMDPLATITRSISSLSRAKLLDQYKIQATENFVEEFYTILDQPLSELRKNPYEALLNPRWSNTVDRHVLGAAKNYRRAALSLLRQQSETQKSLNWVRSKLLNGVYDKFGFKSAEFVDEHLLSLIKDPTIFMRNVAFHSKLGLFNPVQAFLQSQTLTHIVAIAGPQVGGTSLMGSTLMRFAGLTLDESVVRSLAKKSEAFGWKADDFIESYNEMKRSGIYNVGGEVAVRDDWLSPKLFQSSVGKFLDKGTIFFTEGERIVRITAWNAAYLEWRSANPTARITNGVRANILRRQNDLSLNMTYASNAMWQRGPLSVPTQFFGYQARLMEQFLGKRLTREEKLRAFSTYAMMYGLPVAIGAPLGVYPWYEDIRAGLLERGINADEGALSAILDGLPSTALRLATGLDENYGERYGPGGLSFFKDVFNGETSALEIAFGASGSILGDMLSSTEPGWNAIRSVFSDSNETYPLVPEDFINAFSNISSINNTTKMVFALNTGKYVSKNQMRMGDVTPIEAVLMGVAGLEPQRFTDTFIKLNSLTELKDAQKEAEKQVVKYLRLGFSAKTEEEKARYFKAAKLHLVMGGFRPDQYADIFRNASRTDDFYSKMNWDFVTKGPTDQQSARQRALTDKETSGK